MGDLADAIRDHLELKRRRGADPAEVAREEEEALSPVTRSHPVVTLPDGEPEHEYEELAPHETPLAEPEALDAIHNGGVAHAPDGAEVVGEEAELDADIDREDATQEYFIGHGGDHAPEEND